MFIILQKITKNFQHRECNLLVLKFLSSEGTSEEGEAGDLDSCTPTNLYYS